MSLNFPLPDKTLSTAIDNLEETLRQDVNGDKARALHHYFSNAELHMRGERARQTDFEQGQFAGLLADAFSASTRSIVSAWHALHGRELTL
ncbi:hypothetical protein [Bordetella muralis]|jgi:hypothetical protein|uniref:hypothetical protein n=1 Tax=Bordetella muralis TaxID=1649130 RepID=UPI0039EE7F24